jgi:predicted nucleic acid-binding protein
MTARTTGMKVVTANRGDFTRIAAIEPFELELVA